MCKTSFLNDIFFLKLSKVSRINHIMSCSKLGEKGFAHRTYEHFVKAISIITLQSTRLRLFQTQAPSSHNNDHKNLELIQQFHLKSSNCRTWFNNTIMQSNHSQINIYVWYSVVIVRMTQHINEFRNLVTISMILIYNRSTMPQTTHLAI